MGGIGTCRIELDALRHSRSPRRPPNPMPEAKKDSQPPRNNEDTPKQDNCLVAEAESAAADAEPMGSVAAAVPGSDLLAQDSLHSSKQPGAEATELRNQPSTTAGTETRLETEEKKIAALPRQAASRRAS